MIPKSGLVFEEHKEVLANVMGMHVCGNLCIILLPQEAILGFWESMLGAGKNITRDTNVKLIICLYWPPSLYFR